MSSSIVRRSLTSVSWNIVSQAITIAVGFGRSILLARLLEVDTFGIYAGALAIVGLVAILPTLGIPGAFLHRAPETQDEDRAAAVYLAVQSISTLIWLALMLATILLFATGASRTALLVITATTAVEQMTAVPNFVHIRRVVHRRLALIGTVNVVATAVVTVAMAWWGFELWALLAGEFVTSLVLVTGLYLWRPIWRAHVVWDRSVARYYVGFGLPNMLATLIENTLQKIDDIFVRYRLGVTEMGFYSRAFTFATYPRSILAAPVTMVAGGAFAELAHDRVQLSKAFFRTLALLVRAGFLLSGWLVLIAPEFVTILLGEKWLPMVPIFRLLSVFALLDPVRDTLGTVFIAVGQPGRLLRFRLIQLGVLLVGLAVLGSLWGTVGVALAVDSMLAVGIALLVWAARPWVDFSPLRLFAAPSLALVVAMVAALGVLAWAAPANPWLSGLLKSAVFVGLYAAVLLLAEREQLMQMVRSVRHQMGKTNP